jgi:hypothetical protein
LRNVPHKSFQSCTSNSARGGAGGLHQHQSSGSGLSSFQDAAAAAAHLQHCDHSSSVDSSSANALQSGNRFSNRYKESWERVLGALPPPAAASLVPPVILSTAGRSLRLDSAALSRDMQHLTDSLARERRADSEHPRVHAGGYAYARGCSEHARECVAAPPARENEYEQGVARGRGGERGSERQAVNKAPLLYDPDEETSRNAEQCANWREQLC